MVECAALAPSGREVVMQTCRLMFGNTEIASITSVEELEEILVRIRKSFDPPNPVLELVHPNGQVLALAISKTGCFLNYLDTSEPLTSYSSVGDRTLSSKNGSVDFMMPPDGPVSPIPRRNIITFEDLLNVARSFYVSGVRPESIVKWEMDL